MLARKAFNHIGFYILKCGSSGAGDHYKHYTAANVQICYRTNIFIFLPYNFPVAIYKDRIIYYHHLYIYISMYMTVCDGVAKRLKCAPFEQHIHLP